MTGDRSTDLEPCPERPEHHFLLYPHDHRDAHTQSHTCINTNIHGADVAGTDLTAGRPHWHWSTPGRRESQLKYAMQQFQLGTPVVFFRPCPALITHSSCVWYLTQKLMLHTCYTDWQTKSQVPCIVSLTILPIACITDYLLTWQTQTPRGHRHPLVVRSVVKHCQD